jgi:hypothetical protein
VSRVAKYGIWSLAIAAGALQAWVYRWTGNPDGISYIDIAREWMTRPGLHAVSTYWSPLFSWCLALVATITGAAPLHWLGVGHAVGAICFVGTLGAAAMLLKRVSPGRDVSALALAAALSAVVLADTVSIDAELITPDILLCCMTVLASCCALDVLEAPRRAVPAVKLGLVLGVAYLAKAVALYIAGTMILAVIVAGVVLRRSHLRVAVIAAVSFLVIAGPWIAVQSRASGAFTTGSAGRVAYPQEVLGVPRLGSLMPRADVVPGASVARGATLVTTTPWLVRADSTLPGLSPIQYDVSRWHASDPTPHLDVAALWQKFLAQASSSWPPFALVLALLGVLLFRGRGALEREAWAMLLVLGAPLFVVGGMYLLILAEPRYLAPLWLPLAIVAPSLLAGVSDAAEITNFSRRVWSIAVLMFFVVGAAPALLRNVTYAIADLRGVDEVPESVWPQLDFLARSGVVPGEQVALIGDPYEVAWAIPLGVRVALITPGLDRGDAFVAMNDAERAALLLALHAQGVRHLVIRLPVSREVAGMQTDELAELGVVAVP